MEMKMKNIKKILFSISVAILLTLITVQPLTADTPHYLGTPDQNGICHDTQYWQCARIGHFHITFQIVID
jgi:hypothetical protein